MCLKYCSVLGFFFASTSIISFICDERFPLIRSIWSNRSESPCFTIYLLSGFTSKFCSIISFIGILISDILIRLLYVPLIKNFLAILYISLKWLKKIKKGAIDIYERMFYNMTTNTRNKLTVKKVVSIWRIFWISIMRIMHTG